MENNNPNDMSAEELKALIYKVHDEKMKAIEEKNYEYAARCRDQEKSLMDIYVKKVMGDNSGT